MKNIQWVTLRSYFECVPWGRDLKFIRIDGKIKTKGEQKFRFFVFCLKNNKKCKNRRMKKTKYKGYIQYPID
jgi:hypothetical protein